MKESKDLKIKNNRYQVVFLLFLAACVITGVIFSTSYGLFQKKLIVQDVTFKVGELNYKIESVELTNGSITVPKNSSKDITIKITSNNPIASKYELYYNTDDSTNVEVGYYDNTPDAVAGTVQPDESKTILMKIVNNSTADQPISFGVEGGFDYNELDVTKGLRITKEFQSYVPGPVSEKVFVTENLGENCKTYNDGTDTFLVGQCNQNYVWYSGKLWRVVLKNNATGAVKMVTDNAITAISYNASGNSAFLDSYVDQWLTQEFLPTLHNYEDYLVVNSIWDATLDNSSAPSRPAGTTTVQRTVGLLNVYEYYTTYNKSDGLATYSAGYLNNGIQWWLITPYSASNIRSVYTYGNLNNDGSTWAFGIRPSVNFQSNISITSGGGTRSDPYRLENDKQETIDGTTLLSTRYSGEYITFNHELYRIVGVEDSKTKITAVDNPTTLSSNQFHSASGVTSFAAANIKTDLETYYQNDIIEPYKSMIEPNQTWYLGIVGDATNYKASICKTVDTKTSASICERTNTTATASVGLPRLGEVFTSQITRGTKVEFWALTTFNASYVWYVHKLGNISYYLPTNSYGIRPSMYLKSKVVISKNNTGDGTYEHPYDIELGS